MLDIIAKPLGMLMLWIFNVVNDYGLAIIVFTILTKILLLPLNIKQTESTKKMNEINPKMKALQEKYKNDKEKLNQKLMELYKEENYNPASGCLPMLIQMPIIFALFYVIQQPIKYVFTEASGINFAEISKSFLWIKDLSLPESGASIVMIGSIAIPILAILSGLTTFIQFKMTMPKGNKDQTQSMMSTIMPVFIGWMSYTFPSGLVIYWIVGNIFTIAQQYFMLRVIPAKKEA
ncbi:MAG: YidC/Oxa1 family membrane protein insertase [Bacillota bacterium]